MNAHVPIIFIIGSPRSGTTLLGRILEAHPDIAVWYEPYFMWDKNFRNTPHDERTKKDATTSTKQQIRHDILRFQNKTKLPFIVDKSPRNSLKIPFILEIFPNAHFIHLLRDGRDVVLSIQKEWKKRENIITTTHGTSRFEFKQALAVVAKWLQRQSFITDSLRALWFETHGHLFDTTKHLNRLRWNGSIGWGPRYTGWEIDFEKYSRLEFNALQWLHCVQSIKENWDRIDEKNRFEIRYENLVSDTQNTLEKIFKNLKIDLLPNFSLKLPVIKDKNFNKWQTELSAQEISIIKPILSPLLGELEYLGRSPWE